MLGKDSEYVCAGSKYYKQYTIKSAYETNLLGLIALISLSGFLHIFFLWLELNLAVMDIYYSRLQDRKLRKK